MPLTAKQVQNAKPGRHSDGKGLYLLVKPTGSKSWVLRVMNKGLRRDWGLGSVADKAFSDDYARFPLHKRRSLTLGEARDKARLGRELARHGVDPAVEWRRDETRVLRTFKDVARECHQQATKGWRNIKHRDEWLGSLDRYAFPMIGNDPVEEINAAAVQRVLLPIWLSKGETARRVKQRIAVVLDYAHAKGLRSTEAPMRAVNQLMRTIKQPKSGNFPSMPYRDVPAFMEKLRGADLSVGRLALQFLVLTAARSGEIRHAQWKDIDLKSADWRVPPREDQGRQAPYRTACTCSSSSSDAAFWVVPAQARQSGVSRPQGSDE